VDGQIAEVGDALLVVERPARVGDAAGVTGVSTDRRIAGIDDELRLIVDVTDKAAAAAHQELAIPVVGQQQRELDLGSDDAGDAAVRHFDRTGSRRNGHRFGDLHVRQFQLGQLRAVAMAGGHHRAGRCGRGTLRLEKGLRDWHRRRNGRHGDSGQCSGEECVLHDPT
jgi:hypothetical protein